MRNVTSDDEGALDAFIRAHPGHGPGHRRQFAKLEAVFGNRELSVIALLDGNIVGYAPAFLIEAKQFVVWRSRLVGGGSLVASGPLVDASLAPQRRAAVLTELIAAIRRQAAGYRATWLRYSLSSMSGDSSTVTAERPFPMLAMGCTLRTVPSSVLDLSRSEDALFAEMSATTRNLIRKSVREGLESRDLRSRAEWQQFSHAANSAFGHRAAASVGLEAVHELLIAPPDGSETLAHATVVLRDAEPLSCVVTCESNGTSYYFLALNTEPGLALNANRLALWQAIRGAKARGARWFQLGSRDFGLSKSARISDFKQQFGGTVVMSPVAEWCERPRETATTDMIASVIAFVKRRGRVL